MQTIIEPASGWKLLDLREVWRYRDLLVLLGKRDISVRYRQTLLGVAWAVLQPLAMMAVFTLVLGRLARMPSDGIPYPLFVLSGWLSWHFFSQAMNAAGNSVVSNPNLVTKVYVPRLVIPAAALGAPLVDLLVASALMAGVMLVYGVTPGPMLLLLPALFALVALLALGVGAFVAAVTVSYRDFRHLMPFLTTLWMWLTPVVYPVSAMPEQWRWILWLNPLTGSQLAIRSAWLNLPIDWAALGVSVALSALIFWAGLAYFRQFERRFADVV